MSETLSLLLRTFAIGVAVAAPVGAMGVLCIQRTISHGWRIGVATGAGIATADALYAAAAAFGVSAVSSALLAWQVPLRMGGGAFLLFLGVRSAVRACVRPMVGVACPQSDSATGLAGTYSSAVALTLTNPMTVMAFSAVFASAGLATDGGAGTALAATLGVSAGSFAWWLGLTAVIASVRHTLPSYVLQAIGVGSGSVVAGFGALAIVGVLV